MTVETHCRWLVGLSSLSWLHLMSCCLFVYLPAGSVANWDGTPACGGWPSTSSCQSVFRWLAAFGVLLSVCFCLSVCLLVQLRLNWNGPRTQHLSCQSVFPSVCLFVTIVMDSVLLPVGYVTCEMDHQHWRGDPTAKRLSSCVSVCICLSQSMSDANFSLHSLTPTQLRRGDCEKRKKPWESAAYLLFSLVNVWIPYSAAVRVVRCGTDQSVTV